MGVKQFQIGEKVEPTKRDLTFRRSQRRGYGKLKKIEENNYTSSNENTGEETQKKGVTTSGLGVIVLKSPGGGSRGKRFPRGGGKGTQRKTKKNIYLTFRKRADRGTSRRKVSRKGKKGLQKK